MSEPHGCLLIDLAAFALSSPPLFRVGMQLPSQQREECVRRQVEHPFERTCQPSVEFWHLAVCPLIDFLILGLWSIFCWWLCRFILKGFIKCMHIIGTIHTCRVMLCILLYGPTTWGVLMFSLAMRSIRCPCHWCYAIFAFESRHKGFMMGWPYSALLAQCDDSMFFLGIIS